MKHTQQPLGIHSFYERIDDICIPTIAPEAGSVFLANAEMWGQTATPR
jgi:hypothetical protein